MSRLLKKKIVNYIMNRGNKCSSERLLKNSLKNLTKNNKKNFKNIVNLALNYSLPTFQLQTSKVRIKKIKLIKFKPFFILNNKQRVSFSIKFIIQSSYNKKNIFFKSLETELVSTSKLSSESVTTKNQSQEKVIIFQNILTFYRWG